ncbi:carbohydrate ABC transporter permease [Jiangella alkaliphila]|uniref:Raffinose/stachyose/melibiose transport system permease protein n=1 Tax=Jiangella alkaliphila TaxID=419479 RepID=A0A1H2KWX4_9ACTN|nr:carbohydrate ABC transporter permease [Jiangella alkaliphila]SDU73065.1 raffinose/stachyose/melibiose transport system permease protein [Jiangella alkaliphila]
MSRRRIRETPNVLGALGGLVWVVVTIVPVYYLVLTSLRRQQDYYVENPLLPPADPTLDAYRLVLENDFLRYLTNSLVVTVASVVVILTVSLMASYYLVRSGTPLSRGTLRLVLLGLAIPVQATIIPVYYLIVRLGLYDSLVALVLPAIAFAIPISVLIIVNFVRDIPAELFESMRADGAGHGRILLALVLPLSRPALLTVGIYQALQVWNGFLFPLVLTQSSSVRVLPLSLWTYQGQFAVNVPAVLAAVTLSALPVLAAFIVGRRQLVSGLTAGFGK